MSPADFSWIEDFFFFAPPLVVAVVLHEVAHGYVAGKLGDPTARNMGRLTLNPIRHIDPMMTIILPALLVAAHSPVVFGGAKPVPVNPGYFRNPRRGMAIVAIAGPITNFILAGLFYGLFELLVRVRPEMILQPSKVELFLAGWVFQGILINLVLGTFNLIPIPPLDGGRIAVGFLPIRLARAYARLERYGLLLLFLFLWTGWFQKILTPIVELVVRGILGNVVAAING